MLVVLVGVATYLSVVRYLRYKNIRSIQQNYDPERVLVDSKQAEEIFSIMTRKEFPFITRKGLEFALFKTYTIPTISALLAATGELRNACLRRVEDTDLILSEITDTYSRIRTQLEENPSTPESHIASQGERSDFAMNRLNEIHGRYRIRNDDYIYTLSLFIDEPIKWINQYEWREVDIRERNAIFKTWYDIGVKMNIQNIPGTPEEMTRFKNEYGSRHIRYSPSNWNCGEPTIRLLISKLPSFLKEPAYRFSLKFLPSILDRQDAMAFQLPEENKMLTSIFRAMVAVRAFIIKHFFLPRSGWVHRTSFYPNNQGKYMPRFNTYGCVYPEGYRIPELGPESFRPTDPAQL